MVDAGDPAASTRRRFGRYDSLVLGVALVLVLIIIAVAVAVYQHRSAALPPPSSSASGQSSSTGTAPDQRVPTSSVSRRELGRAALPDAAGYEIIGFGPAGLIRLRPDRGEVIETTVSSTVSGQNSVVAGRSFVVAQALDDATRYVFPDGEPARRSTHALAGDTQILPGPVVDQIWVITQISPDEQPVARPVGADGVPTSGAIPVPYGTQAGFGIYADGTGFLVMNGIGGWYGFGPTGLRRITTGSLLAIGPTRWLTIDCDDADRCRVTTIDRSTGGREVLPGVIPTDVGFPGLISPDGRWAVLSITGSPTDGSAVMIVDLTTGKRRTAELEADTSLTPSQLVWSPDSRWLIALDSLRGLVGVDPSTGRATEVVGDLPSLTAITVRTD